MAADSADRDARPRRQRVAAYAVIVRPGADGADEVLLSRLAPYLSPEERWTLPGGGIDFGEHPRDAVVREVYEETGLDVTVGELAWIDSARRTTTDPTVEPTDMHSVRMVFEGWVPRDAPEPHVVEVDGSTVDAAWHRLADVVAGLVPATPTVRQALTALAPARHQRLAAYAVLTRGAGDEAELLLTRISARGHHAGSWTLPGGGVDHGESPADAVRREVREETGLEVEVGRLLGVHDVHFAGAAPTGRFEDFHGVHLLFAASPRDPGAAPRVVEEHGTTDSARWVTRGDVEAGRVEVLDVVRAALAFGA
ncbi:MAG: NUDIX hydrolase [Marmoricola sp.]